MAPPPATKKAKARKRPPTRFCGKCGKVIMNRQWAHCPSCGVRLGSGEEDFYALKRWSKRAAGKCLKGAGVVLRSLWGLLALIGILIFLIAIANKFRRGVIDPFNDWLFR